MGKLWEAEMALVPPPGFTGEDEPFIEADRAVRYRVIPFTDDGGARYAKFVDWLWGNLPEEPHWYLDHVAVDAERRGKGIGRALIRCRVAKSEADRVPAFLFSGRPERVPMFEHVGFRIELDENAPDGGPHVWFMRVNP